MTKNKNKKDAEGVFFVLIFYIHKKCKVQTGAAIYDALTD